MTAALLLWWTASIHDRATRPLVERADACAWARTNALALLLPRAPSAHATTEVQLCAISVAGWEPCEPARALTFERGSGDAIEVLLEDLAPSTQYHLYTRDLVAGQWSPRLPLATCRTPALASDQVGGVRLAGRAPSADAMAICWEAPSDAAQRTVSNYTVLWGPRDDPHRARWSTTVVDGRETRAKFGALRPGVAYEFRVRASFAGGAPTVGCVSDPVVFRTATPGVVARELVRISEGCGMQCEPDYISERNSADARADVGFITEVTSRGGSPFGIVLDHAVITRYCIEHADVPFRDYLSCNPGSPPRDSQYALPSSSASEAGGAAAAQAAADREYHCECNVYIDRLIARADTSMCRESLPGRPGWKRCECDAPSLARAHAGVGRLEVFLPFPERDGTPMVVPPVNESLSVGYWYDTPRSSECAAGEPVGAGGCAWRRLSDQQVIVRGGELVEAGWQMVLANATIPELHEAIEHNYALLDALRVERTARCCGC
jgi:hypothetical protein